MKTFKIKSGFICVTDPCYNKEIRKNNFDLPALNGDWVAKVEYDKECFGSGRIISKLYAFHKNYVPFSVDEIPWQLLEYDCGVDSGQCGIFCSSIYPKGKSTGEYSDLISFYGKVCELTNNEDQWGVLPYGVCSSTGYGDGSYEAKCQMDFTGKIVAVMIDYLSEEE